MAEVTHPTGETGKPLEVTPVEPEKKPRKKSPVIVCRVEPGRLLILTDEKGERLEFPSTTKAIQWCKKRITQQDTTHMILTLHHEFKLEFATKTVATMV